MKVDDDRLGRWGMSEGVPTRLARAKLSGRAWSRMGVGWVVTLGKMGVWAGLRSRQGSRVSRRSVERTMVSESGKARKKPSLGANAH